MNSRVSWSVEGIEPSVRERAEAAARRAGMTLGEWISAQVGDTPPFARPQSPPPPPPLPETDVREVADIHQRLDEIARQIELMSRPAPRGEPAVARQLNDAISRLDARLAKINEPGRAPAAPSAERQIERVERAAAQVYSNSPPISPGSLDYAIAEIAARQSELEANAPRVAPARAAAPVAAPPQPAAPSVGLADLEQQLRRITDQIDALQQRPDNVEQSIAAFRTELAEIRQAITEAMPQRAIETLENEVRSLAQRIDDSRQCGIDAQALAGIERALTEIRAVLRTLTPAEQLAGFDEAIRNLGGKIDLIVRSSDDPGTLQQLETAIAALRAIVANVASNEALARLSDDVQALSSKIDQLASADHSVSFAALEQRIAALTLTLENRERAAPAEPSAQLEGALQALSQRLDNLPVGNDGAATFAHLEQRVSYLLERLEATSESRGANGGMTRIEEGLQDILRHLERQQDNFTALSKAPEAAADAGVVDTIKRDISDLRMSQSELDRHTQDSLEAVHNTLGHVVDRLATIEGDLRAMRSAPASAAEPPPMPARSEAPSAVPAPPLAITPRPEENARAVFEAAPRQFPAQPAAESESQSSRSIKDILEVPPVAAPVDELAASRRAPAKSELAPDFPLEPGTRPAARTASPSERIAASESAISDIAAPKAEPSDEQTSSSSFIAAARRAAQAAAAAAQDKGGSGKKQIPIEPAPKAQGTTLGAKIRSLLVGASVVVIVLGTFRMAMTMLDSGSTPPVAESSVPMQPPPSLVEEAAPALPITPPSMTSPTPIDRQSMFGPATEPAEPEPAAAPAPAPDVTGSISAAPRVAPAEPSRTPVKLVSIPAGEKLPVEIGGPQLRNAALKGDPNAAYEIGVRYAEGRGVAVNYDEAAKWYQRAAQAEVVPAIFRIGTLYEKGLAVKKDLEAARRYYTIAAERGNAKAMHNLAVLEADGGARGPNYKVAAHWFRKAAERGVADSQFNLGILYARGIGVEQNLAESFKWFSLAAAQGDIDSGRKRDDVAKRLDAQSLAAAKLAIQTFTAEPQPADAVNAVAPPNGWDGAPATTAKTVGKRAAH
jgi:localization factor PodJL